MPRLQDLKLKYLTIQPDNITDNGLTINGNADFNSNVSISSNLNVSGNTIITGDLTVEGTTTIIESVTTVYQDPILQIGGTTAPTTDDNKDRGISFFYFNGSAKTGFMGYDDSADGFTFLKDATIVGEVASGTLATLQTSGISATSSTFDLDCSGAMSLNSSAGVINIGDDAIAQNINIGSGASARTIQIGNAASTATNLSALAINLTSVDALTLTDGIATFSLGGTGATSLSAATTVDLDCSGAMSLNSSAGVINIGDDAIAQNINIGSGASARTIQIGNAATTATNLSALAINLTSVDALTLTDEIATLSLGGTGATSLSGATTVDLDCSGDMSLNSSAGVINIGDDAINQNINIGTQGERTISIGTGAFADTINIGNATGATSVSITAGTTGIPMISDTATTNNAVSISADALTTGSALDITSTSNAKTSGSLVNIAQTGVSTTQETHSMTVSTSATSHVNAGVASFTGNSLTIGNAVSISATAITTGSALKITAVANTMGINVDAGVSRFNGGSITQGTTVETGGGAQSPSAIQLINGYAYVGAAAAGVNLTLPGADAIQTALTNMGIISAAGTRLPPIIIVVTDANNLTVSGGTGETVHGTAAINNKTAIIHYIFTGAATSVVIVTQA